MDEVDGMSGNEDRGGVQELIALIKKAKIPIIAMCNDRNHPKIRSLANHCFDLRFQKPRIEQIRVCVSWYSIYGNQLYLVSPSIVRLVSCFILHTCIHLYLCTSLYLKQVFQAHNFSSLHISLSLWAP